jgi:PAS domain S-box-containing protein
VSEPAGRLGAYAALLQEDLDDLYEHAPCGYLSTDPDGVVLKANATFFALGGWDAGAIVGRARFLDLLTSGGRIFYETHMRPLLRMQGAVREIALDLRRADDAVLPVLVNAVERRSADGQALVIRITVFDASDRRRYERELLRTRREAEQAAASRRDLIGMVSHDVRAPLSAMLTAAAMLEKTSLTAQQARYLRIVQSSAQHALTLLNSILDLSTMEAGRTVLAPRPFDPRQVVEQVTAAARLAASQKPALEVLAAVDDATPADLVGDPDRLGQVLSNLMTNAVKFTERGHVTLRVDARDVTSGAATLEFSVADTGIGIAADRLAHIFDEFTQASPEIRRQYGGSGLGLSISRKLLRLFGSELQVASTLGEGTTFSFALTLPRAAGE